MITTKAEGLQLTLQTTASLSTVPSGLQLNETKQQKKGVFPHLPPKIP